jgi:outer membrane protein OmpA-like peptidoglycan-associated protein
MLFRPVIAADNYSVSLPGVVVYGGHIARMSSQRRNLTADATATARRGEAVEYRAAAAAQYWMREAELQIESATADCCCTDYNDTLIVAVNLLEKLLPELRDTVIYTTTKVAPPPFVTRSIGDTLAMSFPFVAPRASFDPDEPFDIYDDERDNSLIIYFRQNRHVIDPAFSTNRRALTNLISAIEMITSSSTSRVTHIVIGGFASPEGSFAVNDHIARGRAVAVKEYIVKQTGFEGDKIVLYNGTEDWRGLRGLVEASTMEYRDEVLDIIDNTPIWDAATRTGRQSTLMRLEGGEPWRYIYRNFFPLLRNGAFIKVYYENN